MTGETDINHISSLLFQLGHENEIQGDILDIEFTPNKGDCLSVFGIARDLNAVHKANLDLDLYSGHIGELDYKFNNDLPFLSKYFISKNRNHQPTKKYKPYLENYFKELKNPKNNFFSTYPITLRMR